MSTSSEMQYLIGSVAQALQKGLSEVILKKPHDPIEYLATWLYAYQGTTRADREDVLQAQKDVKTEKAKRIEEVEHEQLVAERDNVAAEEAALNLSLMQAAEQAAPQTHQTLDNLADLTSDSDKPMYESGAELEPDTDRAGDQPEQGDAADLEEQTQMEEQQQEQDGELQADEQPLDTARTDQSELAEGQALDDQLQFAVNNDEQPLQEESARSQDAAEAQDEQDAAAQDEQQADEPSEQADAPADTARSEADE